MSNENLKIAAHLFLEAIPAFESYELLTQDKLIFYTIITSVFALERRELQEKVVRSKEIRNRVSNFSFYY
jgi:hypothetical protein